MDVLMAGRQELILTWLGKENRPRLEQRILLEDPSKSSRARRRVASADFIENRLIFGDNPPALFASEWGIA